MKARKLLLMGLLSTSMTGFCANVIVTSTIGNIYSPDNIIISPEDVVIFQLAGDHNALEVSQLTYQENGGTALPGGFNVPFGGGSVLGSSLSLGTHWYICSAHISTGMKGTITVTALGVNDFQLAKSYSVFPNPANEVINIKSNESSSEPYTVIDQGGRVVLAAKLNDISTSVDLSQLTSGIYFLQVGDDRRQTFKLIKK